MPGIWAPKCARIPAEKAPKIRGSGVAVVQLCCRPSPIRTADSLSHPDETPVCQCHGGCNLQPAPQVVGVAGLQVLQVHINHTEHTATVPVPQLCRLKIPVPLRHPRKRKTVEKGKICSQGTGSKGVDLAWEGLCLR